MTFSKLGTDIDTGQIVELPQASRRQGLYIIGATGMGKSGLLENLIVEDSKQGLGVCLLDAHGDLTHAVLSRLDPNRVNDVILLDLSDFHYPFGLNLFTCRNPTDIGEVSRASSKVMHIFKKLWGKGGIVVDDAWGVLLEEILRNATMTFLEYSQYEVYTMAEIPLLLEDAAFRNHLIQKLSNRHVKNYWLNKYNKLSDKDQLEERRSTLNRLNAFLTQPIVEYIVGQAKTTVDFRAAMDERKIVLVMFDRQMEDVTSLIGSMIIAELLTAANSRKDIPLQKRKQFNVYADEFQLFATEDFATLLTEARKFGIATTVAHQARYQPGMTDGIRATTIAVPNVVVFQISGDDAEVLAGKFKITPHEAWEEELEEEQLEIREQERLEMMEVIDGEEEIDTPVKDVVGHLLKGGSHPDPVVNAFALGWLQDIADRAIGLLPTLNMMLYNAMTARPLPSDYYPMFFSNVFSIGDGSAFGRGTRGYSNILHCLDGGIRNEYDTAPAYDAFIEYFLTVNPAYLDKFYEYVKEYIRKSLLQKITGNLERLRVFPKQEFKAHDVNKYSYSMLGLTNIQFEYHVHVLETYPSQETLEKAVGYWEEKCAKETWYTIDAVRLAQLEWEISIIPEEYTPMGTSKRNEYALWKPVPGQEEQFYHPADLAEEVDRIFTEETEIFEERVADLKDVMQALADEPIYAGSGIRQPRKRQQILLHPEKTFPHPRVAIPHPQRPYADIRNEIANDIANLPKFTARVKIALDDTQNVEHMIKTLAPGQVIARSLPQRIATIQAQNRKPDQFGRVYCRSRKEVEAEITNRQSSWDGSSPARPQQQARHARQVPVQGKCQNCGASNSPGSQFCNQCGTKL